MERGEGEGNSHSGTLCIDFKASCDTSEINWSLIPTAETKGNTITGALNISYFILLCSSINIVSQATYSDFGFSIGEN